MPDQISHAKEVYYNLPKDPVTGTRKIVPVRGLYVTDEWKPPLQVEPILRIVEIVGEPALVETYTTANEKEYDPTTTGFHLYDASMDTSNIPIDWYSSQTIPNQTDPDAASIHLYSVTIDSTMTADWYSRQTIPNQVDNGSASIHLYAVTMDCTPSFDIYTHGGAFSNPEPILRLTEMFTDFELSNAE